MKDRIGEIRDRVGKAQVGPWAVADYKDKEAIGRNWEIADFGECAHHNKKVWMTTDRLNASRSNGACPCEDADFAAHARADIPALLARVDELERVAAAAKRVLERIDANGGLGEYKGGPPFVVPPLRAALSAAGMGEK